MKVSSIKSQVIHEQILLLCSSIGVLMKLDQAEIHERVPKLQMLECFNHLVTKIAFCCLMSSEKLKRFVHRQRSMNQMNRKILACFLVNHRCLEVYMFMDGGSRIVEDICQLVQVLY